MQVILLWCPDHYGPAGNCVAISWQEPERDLFPSFIIPKTMDIAWLEYHGNPVYRPGVHRMIQIEDLAKSLGRWPEPISIQCRYMDTMADHEIFTDTLEGL